MVAALAYSVIEATDLNQWQRFAEDVVGFCAQHEEGGLALRMDERAGRFFVRPSDRDGYSASGWEVRTEEEFASAIDRLAAQGVEWTRATEQECRIRHVIDMAWFRDPDGNRHEIARGYVAGFEKFVSPQATTFVTGDLGYGHAVLPAPNIDETRRFLGDALGLAVSDFMYHRPAGPQGPSARIDFLHCENGRHHSLALFEGAVPSGCVHMMVEVSDLDEVGYAYDRALKSGSRLMATLGKHTNDRMVSFYIATPGGFALEFGCGGRVIDWDRHSVFECTSTSLWGHDFSIGFGADEQHKMVEAA